jgi:short-subunit dehydrogenase
MQEEKKVIVIFGGSGPLGDLLFKNYDKNKYIIINISKNRSLELEGVINIKADITKKLDLLKIKFKLKSITERVDVLILGSMFIYHKNLFDMTKKELAYEFDVNLFSQIEIIKLILNNFWETKDVIEKKEIDNINKDKIIKEVRKCFYISSAASAGVTSREDLESYTLEKSSLNFVAKYFNKELEKYKVNSYLYMPGSISSDRIKLALKDSFWKDSDEKREMFVQERVFI